MKHSAEHLGESSSEKNACWREHIRKMVSDLTKLQLGVTKSAVCARSENSSSNSDYCLEISFEVAEKPLSWQLLFSRDEPQFPPDFIFGEEGSDGFIVEPDKLESVIKWNSAQSSSLTSLVFEVYNKFIDYQMSLVSNYPQLNHGWEEFLLETDFAQDCEVIVEKNGPGSFNTVIKLLFDMEVQLDEVSLFSINSEDCHTYLSISFNPPDLSSVTPELHVSPMLSRLMDGPNNLRIPDYGSSSLKTYVTKVHSLLASTVSAISERLSRRKQLVATLIHEFQGSVLEYDAALFDDLTLLLEDKGFYFIVYLVLTEQYPAEKPEIVLQSIYHVYPASEPYRMVCSDFEYDEDWPCTQVVDTIRNSIINNLEVFKEESLSKQK